MNVQEIKAAVNDIISKDTSLNVFFVLTDENGNYTKRRADLAQGETTESFIELFRNYLDVTIIQNEELSLCGLSNSDGRGNALFTYDYNVFPKDLKIIHDFDINNEIRVNTFSFSDDKLNDLKGYLIYLGSMKEGIILYKKHYPVSLIKRDSFLLYKKERRFVKFKGDDILRISGSAQVMKLGTEMYVLDTNNFERNFGFENLILKRASEAIDEIDSIGILEEIQVLKDSAEDISFARKLSKIKEKSPVISLGVSNEDIIEFSKNNPGLKGKFKYSEDGKRIRLDTKASKNDFIKMLNDDFLKSELTKQDYTSIAKDRITN